MIDKKRFQTGSAMLGAYLPDNGGEPLDPEKLGRVVSKDIVEYFRATLQEGFESIDDQNINDELVSTKVNCD